MLENIPQFVASEPTDSLLRDILEATTPIRLKEFQQEIFYLVENRKRQIIVASRQVGKTYALAGLAYAWAMANPGSLVLIVSTGENHAQEILKRVKECFSKSSLEFEFIRDSADEIHLKGLGSRIISRPSNPRTVRGYSPDLLIIDEAAAIEHWYEMQAALFPSVAQTNGTIVLSSTYKGRNDFYKMSCEPAWNAKVYPWHVNPHPDIEEQRRTMTAEAFMEEFDCIPCDDAWSLFPVSLLDECSADEITEWKY